MNLSRDSTKFLVVANGAPPSIALLISLAQKHAKLVAVDGGAHICLSANLKPDLLIGDFDSISTEGLKNCAHALHMPSQDHSDLEKTLDYLLGLGPKEITVCGATGKRLDHTLTNICLLTRYPFIVKFESDRELCFALNRSSLLSCQKGQTISLIPVGNNVRQVFTKGLKWDIHGKDLNKNFLSISNICHEDTVHITFESGDLIVCLDKTSSNGC